MFTPKELLVLGVFGSGLDRPTPYEQIQTTKLTHSAAYVDALLEAIVQGQLSADSSPNEVAAFNKHYLEGLPLPDRNTAPTSVDGLTVLNYLEAQPQTPEVEVAHDLVSQPLNWWTYLLLF